MREAICNHAYCLGICAQTFAIALSSRNASSAATFSVLINLNIAAVSAVGKDWSSYLQLEREPIGSGCIGQVHLGTLHLSDKSVHVAVKVTHPEVKVGKYF
jgi:hypothetical protein